MKAIVIHEPGPPDALELAERPDPRPGPEEVLIDVAYAGVGFVDTLFRAGVFALPMPLVAGIEVAGEVRATGPGVERFAPGDRVGALLNDFARGLRAGGYAQLAVAHQSMTAGVPEGLDLAVAAATSVNGATAYMALHDLARVKPMDRVAVLGASGGLGSIVCRIAAATPARQVIGIVGSARRRALAPSECTHVVLGSELGDLLPALTDGAGLDIVIDPVGGALRELAFGHLAPFGRLVVLGDASGDDRRLSADAAWLDSKQVIGLNLGGVAHLVPDRVSAALESVFHWLARGTLHESAPAIRPLEEASAVHRALEGRTAPPKTVLAMS